jgi:hypothetical protein
VNLDRQAAPERMYEEWLKRIDLLRLSTAMPAADYTGTGR